MTHSTHVDRAAAHRINPFISDRPDCTLDACVESIRLIGTLLSIDAGGLDMSRLYLLFDTIAAALEYERDSTNQIRCAS